ncbi:MAG: transglycosylase domain-containing protein [Treponema sp.]
MVTAVHLFFLILPYPELDVFLHREFSTRIYDRKNNLVQITALQNGLRREFVPQKEIPKNIKQSFVKAEDRRFYFHCGVDFAAVLRALFQNVSNKKNVSGASTITMQLAKLIDLNYQNQQNEFTKAADRSYFQKLKEAFCALKLESRFSKNQILELYLNSIPFGNNVEGVQSASRLYFSKDIKDLLPEEIQTLSLIPRRPVFYSPEKKFVCPFYVPHLVNYLRSNNFFASENGKKTFLTKTYKSEIPYEVHLSIDMDVQNCAQNLADRALENAKDSRVSNISVLAMDVQTGRVLCWVGSNSFFDEENSGQVDGVRFKNHPGSSIKPFLYALALENKIVIPTSVLPDVPMEFGNSRAYIPFNFNNRFNGPVSLRTCLASSLNVPAVYLLDKTGISCFADKLDELHFSDIKESAFHAELSMALGAGEVSLQDFVPAFSVFVRDGKYIPLEYFSEKNSFLKNEKTKCEQIFSSDVSRIIASFLSEKSARALGFGYYQTFETKYQSVFKTGTSNQYQNITALGATPRYAVGVWMGNFSGETVVGKTGSSLPAWVAKHILDFLENGDGLESLSVPEPENYSKQKVCRLSGLAPSENCPSTVYEFVENGKPLLPCYWHKKENGVFVTYYPEQYQRWLSLNENLNSYQSRILYSASPLEILSPRNNAVFFIDKSSPVNQTVKIESTGGTENEIEIYIDGKFYQKIQRPFLASVPAQIGRHKCKILCGNEEKVVFYEVK